MKKVLSILLVLMLATTVFAGGKKEKVEINGIADLVGKKIGTQAGTTGDTWSLESSGGEVASFKTGMDAALDLKNGVLDAVVLDELPAQSIVDKNPDLMIVRDPYFTENKEEYAIAVKKGNTELLASINATIEALQANGGYEALVSAFMPTDGNIQIPPVTLETYGETVKLGTNAAFPPFEYVEGNAIVGFDISMGQYIAKDLAKNLEVVDMAFDSLIAALGSGTIDFVAAGMSVTPEREKNVDFSIPYYKSEQVIIIKK